MSPSVRFSWSTPLMYIIITNVRLRFRSSTLCVMVSLTCGASLMVQWVKNLPAKQETRVHSLGQEDLLQEGMATRSSILAWKIPWTEEPGGLQSTGSQRVGRDVACTSTRCH